MSLTIRLAKIGKRNSPTYKVVVKNTRDKRNGRFLEILGHFDPSKNIKDLKLDNKSLEEWKAKGAMVSEAVKRVIDGTYTYTKYSPKTQKTETKKEGDTNTTESKQAKTEENA